MNLRKAGRGYLIYLALVVTHLIAFLLGFLTMYQVALRVIAERIA